MYTIEHSLAGFDSTSSEWSTRGSVELNFPALLRERGGRGAAVEEDGVASSTRRSDDQRPSAAVKFEPFEFDTAQLTELKVRAARSFLESCITHSLTHSRPRLCVLQRLARSGGYYRVRLQRKRGGAGAPAQPEALVASVPACQLIASGLRELWRFESDVYGFVSALDYSTPVTACSGSVATTATSITARGKIGFGRIAEKVRAARAGVALPQAPGAAGDAEAAAAAAAAANNKPEEKGFFAKYWYVLLPFAVSCDVMCAGVGDEHPNYHLSPELAVTNEYALSEAPPATHRALVLCLTPCSP